MAPIASHIYHTAHSGCCDVSRRRRSCTFRTHTRSKACARGGFKARYIENFHVTPAVEDADPLLSLLRRGSGYARQNQGGSSHTLTPYQPNFELRAALHRVMSEMKLIAGKTGRIEVIISVLRSAATARLESAITTQSPANRNLAGHTHVAASRSRVPAHASAGGGLALNVVAGSWSGLWRMAL